MALLLAVALALALAVAVALALALAVAVALALASLPYPTRKSCGTSHLETQAGSRVEGTRGPSGAPRSGAKRRGKRACSSTGMCELRSGLRFVSTAGNRLRRMRGRRGRGVAFLLVTSLWPLGHSKRSDSAVRPKRSCSLSEKRKAKSTDRGRSPLLQTAKRQATATSANRL